MANSIIRAIKKPSSYLSGSVASAADRYELIAHIVFISIVVVATRITFLMSPAGRLINGDEAVFGIMANLIRRRAEFPIFCWEAQYAGPVVSYIAAVIFQAFGAGFVQLRCAMLPFSLAAPVLAYFVFRDVLNPRQAFVGSLFLIFCPFFILYYSLASLGGYGETVAGSLLIILVSRHLSDRTEPGVLHIGLLGVISGFFFYTLFLVAPAIAVFALPAVWAGTRGRQRRISVFLSGFTIGVSPLIVYNLLHGGGTITRSMSRSFSVGRDILVQSPIQIFMTMAANKVASLGLWFLKVPRLMGQYLVPESFGGSVCTAAGLIILAFFAIFFFKRFEPTAGNLRFRQFGHFFIALVIFVLISGLDQARHLMPMIIILPVIIFSSASLSRSMKAVSYLVIITACVMQFSAWVPAWSKKSVDPVAIAHQMQSAGIRTFFGSYWSVYPVMFVSDTAIKGAPLLLDPGEPSADRRPDWTAEMRDDPESAFLFLSGESSLKARFTGFCTADSIACDSLNGVGYTIYYKCSKRVIPIIDADKGTSYQIKL